MKRGKGASRRGQCRHPREGSLFLMRYFCEGWSGMAGLFGPEGLTRWLGGLDGSAIHAQSWHTILVGEAEERRPIGMNRHLS